MDDVAGRPLVAKARFYKRKWFKWAVAVVIVLLVFRSIFGRGKSVVLKEGDFEYAAVSRRSIRAQISANGNVNPVNLVSVGAQVSGIVDKIFVDYNDSVKQGQLLAVIDKSTLEEEFKSATARVEQAQARLRYAALNQSRELELFGAGYTAKISLDQAEIDLAVANSDYISAKTALERAKLNLGYAEIRSPVSGVIISKAVEEGQTIASSFSAPTLFVIAEDLKKMQIEASISEADIGTIKPGQSVDFNVDAFPLETFKGVVDQIRLNPKTEQNIVVYNVIVKIDNKNGRLLPGMTAFVEINTLERKNVLAAPNAALQYRPVEAIQSKVVYPKDRKLGNAQGFLYRFNARDKAIEAVKITKGVSDGSFAEIQSDEIKEGDMIITDYGDGAERSRGQRPSGGRGGGPMGGGRR
ncbi:MAG: efflux RND transporter periplasmic adaptor subunit [Rickettsiales bacterium]|jgi:HlyD family secretion protein|nr:efflux RND transporter periplasmic adaptor subunit [Rickettsiales bacterium]